ncbi:winged helix-turn-helix domain-containing protein [uncultured Serinicoccus sp.]|uniref:winged helix-turn-helix transcriptional regulator n=1 Tax=uncultured Serinicoccus sp. TaxID=735514 RepID=UPI002612964D|nr:winged helix-turn-helix domain-containing protein [uncultured Serinicoccus sp.]
MPDITMWVIPTRQRIDPFEPAIVISRALGCAVEAVRPDLLPDRMAVELPRIALILGGTFSTDLVEAQRWLNQRQVPVLILAQDLTEQHEALLLGRGAKEVLGLPVSETRLRGRLEAFVRNYADPPRPDLQEEQPPAVFLDLEGRLVLAYGVPVSVTKSELDLLSLLARRSGKVVPRHELATALGKPTLSARALESHISRLRIKFSSAGSQRVIESVRGQGYRLIGTAEVV